MSAKAFIYISAGFLLLNSNTYAEWGRIKCLRDCTDVSCSDSAKQDECMANCPDSALDACKAAKQKPNPSAVPPTPRPLPPTTQSLRSSRQAATEVKPQVKPQVEPQVPQTEQNPDQSDVNKRGAVMFSSPPLGEKPNPPQRPERPAPNVRGRPTTPPSQPWRRVAPSKDALQEQQGAGIRQSGQIQKSGSTTKAASSQPELRAVTGSGGKGVTMAEMEALNRGEGVKVKHMLEMFQGVEQLTTILNKRISMLGSKGKAFTSTYRLAEESLDAYKKKLGLDKAEIRGNPEHPLSYDPVEFSSISGALTSLNGQTCDAALKDIRKNIAILTSLKAANSLQSEEQTLASLCSDIKTPTQDTGKKIQDAKNINNSVERASKTIQTVELIGSLKERIDNLDKDNNDYVSRLEFLAATPVVPAIIELNNQTCDAVLAKIKKLQQGILGRIHGVAKSQKSDVANQLKDVTQQKCTALKKYKTISPDYQPLTSEVNQILVKAKQLF